MTNKILDAISQALNSEFGDSYELYSENIKGLLHFFTAHTKSAEKNFFFSALFF